MASERTTDDLKSYFLRNKVTIETGKFETVEQIVLRSVFSEEEVRQLLIELIEKREVVYGRVCDEIYCEGERQAYSLLTGEKPWESYHTFSEEAHDSGAMSGGYSEVELDENYEMLV